MGSEQPDNKRGERAYSDDEGRDWKKDRDNTPVPDSAHPSTSEDEGDWLADWRKQRSGI